MLQIFHLFNVCTLNIITYINYDFVLITIKLVYIKANKFLSAYQIANARTAITCEYAKKQNFI